MRKIITSLIAGAFVLTGSAQSNTATNMKGQGHPADTAVVYITKEISPEAIAKLYKALGKACTDLVRNSDDHGKIHLIERIASRHGMHTLDYGEQIGLGSQTYKLITLD